MRVLIVSNHTLIAQSLVSMLQSLASDESIQAAVCGFEHAIEQVVGMPPDVTLVEASTDFAAGVETVRLLRSARPDLRVVVLGTEAHDAIILEAVKAGARGYLAKESSTSTLVSTLHGVARGELGLSRVTALAVVELLCDEAGVTPRTGPMSLRGSLTKREVEVFELVRRGLRSREIAARLCIAETTVNKHIQNVLSKLHVHSRTQAVVAVESSLAAHPASSSPRRSLKELHRAMEQAASPVR